MSHSLSNTVTHDGWACRNGALSAVAAPRGKQAPPVSFRALALRAGHEEARRVNKCAAPKEDTCTSL